MGKKGPKEWQSSRLGERKKLSEGRTRKKKPKSGFQGHVSQKEKGRGKEANKIK